MIAKLFAVFSCLAVVAVAQINLRGLDLVNLDGKGTFCDEEVKPESRTSRLNECIFKPIPPVFMTIVNECRNRTMPKKNDFEFLTAMCKQQNTQLGFADCVFNKMISPSPDGGLVRQPGSKTDSNSPKENRVKRQLPFMGNFGNGGMFGRGNGFQGGRLRAGQAGNRGITVSDTSPVVLFLLNEMKSCRDRFP